MNSDHLDGHKEHRPEDLTSDLDLAKKHGGTCGAADTWPPRPAAFPELLTPVEAAQYLRLDELGTHTPETAIRTLNYWRDRGSLKATKYARHVWYLKSELDRFLAAKTEA